MALAAIGEFAQWGWVADCSGSRTERMPQISSYGLTMKGSWPMLWYMYSWIIFDALVKTCPEAEFLVVIGTKVLRVFLLAIYSHAPLPMDFTPLPPTPSKSGLKLVCNLNMYCIPQVWELSRLCPETSNKLYVHEYGFWITVTVVSAHLWVSSCSWTRSWPSGWWGCWLCTGQGCLLASFKYIAIFSTFFTV